MSFPINIQVTNSEAKQIGKVITTIDTLNGVLKEESSILTPTVLLEYPATSLAVANYATIPSFGRSYFITDIRSVRASLTEISLRVDVLESWASQIKNCYAIVSRQERRWNLYLDDGSFKTYSNFNVLTKEFPTGFGDNFYFILAVAGDQ